MDSHSLDPAQGGDADVPDQQLWTKRDQMIHASSNSDFKGAFFHEVWPALEGEYEIMMRQLKEFCENALKHEGIACQITGRTKVMDSIRKSLDRREKALEEQKQLKSLSDILNRCVQRYCPHLPDQLPKHQPQTQEDLFDMGRDHTLQKRQMGKPTSGSLCSEGNPHTHALSRLIIVARASF
jgi:hypothetical protein